MAFRHKARISAAYPLTPERSRRGAEEACSEAKASMQDKASCLSKWPSGEGRAYPPHILDAGAEPERRWRGVAWVGRPNAG